MIEMVVLPTATESFLEGNGKKREDKHQQDRMLYTHNLQFCMSGLSKDQWLPKGQGPEANGDSTTGKAGASPAKAPSPQHPSKESRTEMVTRDKPGSRSPDKLVVMKEGQCETRQLHNNNKIHLGPGRKTSISYNLDQWAISMPTCRHDCNRARDR